MQAMGNSELVDADSEISPEVSIRAVAWRPDLGVEHMVDELILGPAIRANGYTCGCRRLRNVKLRGGCTQKQTSLNAALASPL